MVQGVLLEKEGEAFTLNSVWAYGKLQNGWKGVTPNKGGYDFILERPWYFIPG